MSGRIRSIKPELLEDAITAGLSDMAFRLFIASILLADDYGNLRFEPAWLRGQVYWSRSVPDEQFSVAVGELSALITTYSVNGQRYGSIKGWTKHQRVSHPGKPRVPGPEESLQRPSGESPEDSPLRSERALVSSQTETLRRISGDPRETLVPDLRSPITDHRPPSAEETSWRDQDPEPGDRRFTLGAPSVEAKDRYVAAVQRATGKTFALSSAPHHARDLCDLLNAHAPPGGCEQALVWLVEVVSDWVKSVEAKFTSGYAPAKLLSWLNESRPSGLRAAGPETGASARGRKSLEGFKA